MRGNVGFERIINAFQLVIDNGALPTSDKYSFVMETVGALKLLTIIWRILFEH